MSSKPVLEAIRPETKQLLDDYIKMTQGLKPKKTIDTLPSKIKLVQQLINIVNGKTSEMTMEEYLEELNDNLKICDEQLEYVNSKKKDITDVFDLLADMSKTIQNTDVWIKFNAKNIGTITDNVEYQLVEPEIKVKLSSIDAKNITKLSDSIRELRLSTINNIGQKKIVCVKFNINSPDNVINGYGITRINC